MKLMVEVFSSGRYGIRLDSSKRRRYPHSCIDLIESLWQRKSVQVDRMGAQTGLGPEEGLHEAMSACLGVLTS